jgi:uncharacterized membrane protein YfcA
MVNIKGICQTFVYIMTGTTLSAAIFITLFNPELTFKISLLWQIALVAMISALGNFIYYYKEISGKKQMKFRIFCHFIYINFVVFAGAILFEWLEKGMLQQFMVLFLLITIVYVAIMLTIFRQEEKMAESINRQLRKQFPAEEEGED